MAKIKIKKFLFSQSFYDEMHFSKYNKSMNELVLVMVVLYGSSTQKILIRHI